MSKYFELGKKIVYTNVEKEMMAMKGKPYVDHMKMDVLYFLCSVIVGGRKSGDGASPVDNYFAKVVDDLDA